MADQCANDLPGSIVETFTLAIEVTGHKVQNSPQLLKNLLQSPEIQKKIKESLEKRLEELQAKAKQGRPIDAAQALEQITSVFTVDSVNAVTKKAGQYLEQGAEYRQLKTSLDTLACRFKDSPTGVFYDEPEGVVLIVAVGVIIAGAVGMYIAATGDTDKPLSLLSKLAEAPKINVLGKVDLGLTNVVLKPSEKQYDVGLYAKAGKVTTAEFKIVVQTKDKKVEALPISVETKVPLSKGYFSMFGATYDHVQKNAQFSLGISGSKDSLSVQVKANWKLDEDKKTETYGDSANLKWKPLQGVPMDVTGGFGVARTDQILTDPSTNTTTKGARIDLNVNLGLKVDF